MMEIANTKANGRSRHPTWRLPPRLLGAASALLLCAHGAMAANPAAPSSLEPWDRTRFDQRSTTIDNPWLPMKPGMRYVYEGTTVEDDGKVVPHRIEIHITDLAKEIDGVRALVSYDLDISDGELVEAELAFFAQDRDGNVWRMGEYPEEYEDGDFIKAPAWIHGFEGAQAGIMMKAKPQTGTPSYSEGWGPAVGWTDRGQTHAMGETTKVRTGEYTDVLVIRETSASEQGAYQLKYYARGVGNVRVGWLGADKTKEALELVLVERMDDAAMSAVRDKALQLEQSAYKRSKAVYGPTPPAQRLNVR